MTKLNSNRGTQVAGSDAWLQVNSNRKQKQWNTRSQALDTVVLYSETKGNYIITTTSPKDTIYAEKPKPISSSTDKLSYRSFPFEYPRPLGNDGNVRSLQEDCTCVYYSIDGTAYERAHNHEPMSCLTTRNKLILLCCCAALIAFISSVMVINAFLKWSNSTTSETTIIKDSLGETTARMITQPIYDPLLPGSRNFDSHNKLNIEISVHEVTSPSQITEVRRKWFEINPNVDDEDNRDSFLELDIIDLEGDSESSGSGMDSDEPNTSPVTIIPLRTSKPTYHGYTNTPGETNTNTEIIGLDNSDSERKQITRDKWSSVTPNRSVTKETKQSTLTDTVTSATDPKRQQTHNSESENSYGGDNSDFSFYGNPGGSVVDMRVTNYHIGSPVTPSSANPDEDKCERWLNCEDPFLKGYIEKFSLLPTCPCTYPLLRTNHVYDDYHRKTFKWRDSEYSRSYLAAYQRGAKRCIRSEVGSGTLAAQNCCYDGNNQLLTRGSGAGTPDVISPDVSGPLHQLVDKVPWVMCGGDWTRYNKARPPNNVRRCPENPTQMEYLYQIWLAKNN